MKISIRLLGAACALWSIALASAATPFDFGPWPAGTSPQEIGKRVAANFLARPHSNFDHKTPPRFITYPETCTWYGALTFAQLTGDKDLQAKLVERFDPLFGPEAHLIPKPANVDATVFAAVPLELYIETKDPRYLKIGQPMADAQWEEPSPERLAAMKEIPRQAVKDGLSWQTRYWIDDMYMITMAQMQAYRATGEKKYLDHAANELVSYLDKLQQPNGLFYHAPDVPIFWGRGDGWVAVGMAEVLRDMPSTDSRRPRILAGYHKMMAALLKYQDADGMWHQVIDHPEVWPETSCTGMFTYAFITGVKSGWLDAKTYGPAARKGWLGLQKYLDADANIHEVCQGTNKRNSFEYYVKRGRNVGDFHGQAPLLWCASALLR